MAWRAVGLGSAIIGAVVGAGFASGREILQFFVLQGPAGGWGLLASTMGFIVLGAMLMEVVRRQGIRDYRRLLFFLCGRRLGRYLDAFTGLFLFGGLTVVLAGGGAIFQQELGLDFDLGLLATASLIGGVLWFGRSGVLKFNAALVPCLALIGTAVSVQSSRPRGQVILPPLPGLVADQRWLLSAFLYVSYNMIIIMVIVASLGEEVRDRRTAMLAGLVGGCGLGFLALAMAAPLYRYFPRVVEYDIPMLYVARQAAPVMVGPYLLALWAAMLTSGVANAYGLARRVGSRAERGTGFLILLAALLPARLGFSCLIATVYPLMGVLGAFMVVALIVKAGRQG